jgi:hypothetical protein
MKWKDIKGYEGSYQISNNGEIKSLERSVVCSNHYRIVKERLLKQQISSTGYYVVRINFNGNKRTLKIHQLVWDHFGSSKRNGRKLQVDHIDENKLNNHIDNLQLLTQRENVSKSKFKYEKTSQYTGVRWHKQNKKWESGIKINGNQKYLGQYIDEYDAHLAYKKELDNLGKRIEIRFN